MCLQELGVGLGYLKTGAFASFFLPDILNRLGSFPSHQNLVVLTVLFCFRVGTQNCLVQFVDDTELSEPV